MNTLFLVNEPLTEFGGISKKILAQVNALKRLGLQVALSYLETNGNDELKGRYVNEEMIDKYSEIPFISKLQFRCNYKNLYRYVKEKGIQLVYMRYTHFANPFFISFLKKLKKSGVIVLLEIPTYPYDQEYRDLKTSSKIVLLIERFSRRWFKDLVTRIITLSHDSSIFGIPAISISNGIDPTSINVVNKRKTDNEIHLIAVASMGYWHGYDRLIEGLHNYYINGESGKKKIFLHLVGYSYRNESLRYRKLVTEYNLKNYVKFYEKIYGEELDDLFNRADVAVGCLGCHRKAMEYSKSLKNREYCARGIPFFYAETDEDFEGKDFIYKVPPNDDPIDIEEIINFVEDNEFDPIKIRRYAIENLTWDKQYEKVLQGLIPNFNTPSKDVLQYEFNENVDQR